MDFFEALPDTKSIEFELCHDKLFCFMREQFDHFIIRENDTEIKKLIIKPILNCSNLFEEHADLEFVLVAEDTRYILNTTIRKYIHKKNLGCIASISMTDSKEEFVELKFLMIKINHFISDVIARSTEIDLYVFYNDIEKRYR